MPYRVKVKDKYSNYWFSASDGFNLQAFNNLINKTNIDRLEDEGGACIVYTHFAAGFVDESGCLNQAFIENIRYLASRNGWFVSASELLNYLLNNKSETEYVGYPYLFKLDLIWLYERLIKRIQYGRV